MKPLWGNMGIRQRFVGQHSKNGLKGENNCATCPVLLPSSKPVSYSATHWDIQSTSFYTGVLPFIVHLRIETKRLAEVEAPSRA